MNVTLSTKTNSGSTRMFMMGKFNLPKEDWMSKSVSESIALSAGKKENRIKNISK